MMYQNLPYKTTIALLDDQPIVLHGLIGILEKETDLEICGSAASIGHLLPLVRDTRPDILIADISLSDGDLFESLPKIFTFSRETKVIVFTFHSDRSYLQRAMQFNISGFILKQSEPSALLQAIRAVRRGGVYIDPALLGRAITERRHAAEGLGSEERLSERESDTLRLTAYGYSIKEIARELGVSPKSIETYKARASAKLGLATRSSIVRYALVNGWLTGESEAISPR